MIKSKELTEPKSCLNKAADDEPVFVLRAKDRLEPLAVRLWAVLAEGVHENWKVKGANELAAQMESWRRDNAATKATNP